MLVSDMAIGGFRPLTPWLEGSPDRAWAELACAELAWAELAWAELAYRWAGVRRVDTDHHG